MQRFQVITFLKGRKLLYFVVGIANLLAFSGGIVITWSSPVIGKLQDKNQLDNNPLDRIITNEESSWIGSLMSLGATLGPLLSGYLLDKFGRKFTMLFCGFPYLISFLMLAFANKLWLYYLARLIGGISTGITFTILPMFVAEISEDKIRGELCSIQNVSISLGLLFSYIVGTYLPIMWCCLLNSVFSLTFIIGFFIFAPESPYYLLKIDDEIAAKSCLMSIRDSNELILDNEVQALKRSIVETRDGKITDLFMTKGSIKALIISLGLLSFQQLSGINIILSYTKTIFDATGSSLSPEVSSIIIGAIQFLSSIITPVFVDKLGRRIILLISAAGMLLSELAIGSYFYILESGKTLDAIFWLPLFSLIMYIATYNCGIGPLPWVIVAELFPINTKSLASSLSSSYCWFISFLLTRFFISATDMIGLGGSFWIFSGFNFCALLFVYFYLPETKGISLNDIQKMLKR